MPISISIKDFSSLLLVTMFYSRRPWARRAISSGWYPRPSPLKTVGLAENLVEGWGPMMPCQTSLCVAHMIMFSFSGLVSLWCPWFGLVACCWERVPVTAGCWTHIVSISSKLLLLFMCGYCSSGQMRIHLTCNRLVWLNLVWWTVVGSVKGALCTRYEHIKFQRARELQQGTLLFRCSGSLLIQLGLVSCLSVIVCVVQFSCLICTWTWRD